MLLLMFICLLIQLLLSSLKSRATNTPKSCMKWKSLDKAAHLAERLLNRARCFWWSQLQNSHEQEMTASDTRGKD